MDKKLYEKMADFPAKPDKSIQQHIDELLDALDRLDELGYIPDERIRRLAKEVCCYHDCGKANLKFKERLEKKKHTMQEGELLHNLLSVFFIPQQGYENDDDYTILALSVLNHHNYGQSIPQLKGKEKGKAAMALLNEAGFSNEIQRLRIDKLQVLQDYYLSPQIHRDYILVKSLLHQCDYAASGGYVVEYPNDFLEEGLSALNYQWNDLQTFCRDHGDDNLIVTAQTGMGKTEAGLWWMGNHKGFFVLPLQTAINAMYSRIAAEPGKAMKGRPRPIVSDKIEERVILLHANAVSYLINQQKASEKAGEKGQKDGDGGSDREDPDSSGIEDVLSYYDKGKHWSMPLCITTLDQIIDFVFKDIGYEYKLGILAHSKTVIDEIQMYDARLLAFLIQGIRMIHEVGGKIAIMTATLSPFVRGEIREALGGDVCEGSFEDPQRACRHFLEVKEAAINPEDIVACYREKAPQGPVKILVICNTVKKAQAVYDALVAVIPDTNLLHARMTRMDRREKEGDIQNFTNKDNPDEAKKSGIWVTTSVAEASLDIDFDFLFTELLDLMSLFQRMGRIWRRREMVPTEANCTVYTEIDPNLLISTYKEKSTGFIDACIYELSKAALLAFGPASVITESQKREMIEQTLTLENIKDSNFYQGYMDTKKELDTLLPGDHGDLKENIRDFESVTIIPGPVFGNNRNQILKLKDEWENDQKEEQKIRRDLSKTVSQEDKDRQKQQLAEKRKQRIITENELYDYTVSVSKGAYWRNRTRALVGTVPLGNYRKIEILDCDYSKERGLSWKEEYGANIL